MKITKDVDYAIRTVLYLSIQDEPFSATKNDIAEAMQIPPHYLAKIAQQLYKARIVEITKGSKGLYRLIQSPENISMLNVVEAIKGKIFLNYCVEEQVDCFRKDACYVNTIWCNLTKKVRKYLKNITFKELAEKEMCYLKPKK